jgi:hypothetical protein
MRKGGDTQQVGNPKVQIPNPEKISISNDNAEREGELLALAKKRGADKFRPLRVPAA